MSISSGIEWTGSGEQTDREPTASHQSANDLIEKPKQKKKKKMKATATGRWR